MTTLAAPAPANRTLAAAGAILIYAMMIGFTDNFVQTIARDGGLWQFHATRTAMALALLGLAAAPLRLRLRPRNWRAVAFRSLVHGSGMVVYFGCLAFLPVAVVAAGLFTAPIFTLLISRFVYGARIGPVRIAAVLIGFSVTTRADDDVISKFMKEYHKAPEGTDPVCKKAGAGTATAEELQGLLDGYKKICGTEPPQGDKQVWVKNCQALVAAVKGLQEGKEGAAADYKKAVNCKGCHNDFKP